MAVYLTFWWPRAGRPYFGGLVLGFEEAVSWFSRRDYTLVLGGIDANVLISSMVGKLFAEIDTIALQRPPSGASAVVSPPTYLATDLCCRLIMPKFSHFSTCLHYYCKFQRDFIKFPRTMKIL